MRNESEATRTESRGNGPGMSQKPHAQRAEAMAPGSEERPQSVITIVMITPDTSLTPLTPLLLVRSFTPDR